MIAALSLALSAVSFWASATYRQSASVNEFTFLTEDSYPYKRLVENSDQVSISYKKVNSYQMSCRVFVKSDEYEIQSDQVIVGLKGFADDALKVCLDRELAKEILRDI